MLSPIFRLLCVFGVVFLIIQVLFWTLPQYELDRIGIQLRWRCNAHFDRRDDGGFWIWFQHGTRDSHLNVANKLLANRAESKTVTIDSPHVTRSGLHSVTSMQNIDKLRIKSIPMDVAAMKSIPRMRTLKHLEFDNVAFSDQMLVELENTPNLQNLMISCVKGVSCGEISADGLKSLAKIPTLRYLVLMGMNVPEKEIPKFHAKRPDVTIEVTNY